MRKRLLGSKAHMNPKLLKGREGRYDSCWMNGLCQAEVENTVHAPCVVQHRTREPVHQAVRDALTPAAACLGVRRRRHIGRLFGAAPAGTPAVDRAEFDQGEDAGQEAEVEPDVCEGCGMHGGCTGARVRATVGKRARVSQPLRLWVGGGR